MYEYIRKHPEQKKAEKELVIEPVGNVLNRLFRHKEDPESLDYPDNVNYWKEVSTFVECMLISMATEHDPDLGDYGDDIDAFALLTGSMAREWHIDSPKNHRIGDILRAATLRLPPSQSEDPLYRKALEGFLIGPNNIDIKFFAEGRNISMERLADKLDRGIADLSYTTVQTPDGRKRHTVGPVAMSGSRELQSVVDLKSLKNKSVIQVTYEHPRFSPFTIDITHVDINWLEDYRLGYNQSSKQNIHAYCMRYKDDHTNIYVMNSKELWDLERRTLINPSHMHSPVFSDPTQCTLAGLRMIRNELLWPAMNNELGYHSYGDPCDNKTAWRGMDTRTLQLYKCALAEQMDILKNGSQELNPYRVEEIIREGILCMTIDPVNATAYMAATGLLDVFVPNNGLGEIEERWGFYKNGLHSFPLLDRIREHNTQWDDAMKRMLNGSLNFEDIRFNSDDIPATNFLKAAQDSGVPVAAPHENNLYNLAHMFDLRRVRAR